MEEAIFFACRDTNSARWECVAGGEECTSAVEDELSRMRVEETADRADGSRHARDEENIIAVTDSALRTHNDGVAVDTIKFDRG